MVNSLLQHNNNNDGATLIVLQAPIQRKRPAPGIPIGKTKLGAFANRRVPSRDTVNDKTFKTTKKDKRTIKHSSFVTRIEKANSKATKRRRPSKKLVADLESLANALPDDMDGDAGGVVESGNAKIRHRSLKSRPGAMKRKEKLETMEKERFGKNMAQMVTGAATAPTQSAEGSTAEAANGSGASSTRWAALRGFIQQTMEQKPEFRAA